MPEAGIINVSFYNGHVIINNFLKARLVTEKGIIVLYYEPIVDFLYNFRNYIYTYIHVYEWKWALYPPAAQDRFYL